jgi:hypothetical protein
MLRGSSIAEVCLYCLLRCFVATALLSYHPIRSDTQRHRVEVQGRDLASEKDGEW